MADFYELLELSPDSEASLIARRIDEMEQTWARRARGDDAELRERAGVILADLVDARAVLLDPQSRSAYDRGRLGRETSEGEMSDASGSELDRARDLVESAILTRQSGFSKA